MKAFLEFLSKQDEETRKKAAALDQDGLIALAAEKGFSLEKKDFEKQDAEGEVSLEEADSVAGGNECYCALGGGGTAGHWEKDDGTDHHFIVTADDYVCACVAYGEGDGKHQFGGAGGQRCLCVGGGYGKSEKDYLDKY